MKMITLVYLLLFPTISWAQIQWGNGGEGYFIDGKIYVRDLYESNVHLSPFIGQVEILDLMEGAAGLRNIASLDIDVKLLGRKLSDAELQKKGLGYFVLETIRNYHWAFSPSLDLAPDTTPVVPGDLPRVPLAKRFQHTIKFDSRYFWSLAPEQRIALVMHEALFALLIPRNATGGVECQWSPCVQSDYTVRALTGYLFNSRSYLCRDLGRCLDPYSSAEMNVDWKATENPVKGEVQISLQDIEANYDRAFKVNPRKWNFEETVFSNIDQFCKDTFSPYSVKQNWHKHPVTLFMNRPSFSLKLNRYRTRDSDSVEAYQLGAQIIYREPIYLNPLLRFNSEAHCHMTLKNLIESWYPAN